MMYYLSDETGTLTFQKSKFASLPNHDGQTFNDFLKFFLWILHLGGDISLSFLKKSKILQISFFTITRDSQNLREEMRNHKNCSKP